MALVATLLVHSGASDATTAHSLYSTKAKPAVMAASDSRSVEVGLQFKAAKTSKITAIRFYKDATNTGRHVGSLWTSTGKLLAQTTFNNETASGWQSAGLTTPVTVTAGQTYVVGYHAPNGHYSETIGAFSNGKTIVEEGLIGTKGVYSYGGIAFPTLSWNNASYLVDVSFTQPSTPPASATSSAAPTSAPAASSTAASATKPATSAVPTSSAAATPTAPASSSAATGSYPGASDTGYTGTLTSVPSQVSSGTGWHWDSRGWVVVDGANATFSGHRVTGAVEVYGKNAVIANNDISSSGDGWGVGLRPGSSHTIVENNDIHGANASTGRLLYGVFDVNSGDGNIEILKNDIYSTAHGIQINVGLIQDNYIHALGRTGADHVEGIFCGGGTTGTLTIVHNTISDPYDQVAAIILSGAFGKEMNKTIDNNLLSGGGYTLYGGSPGQNIKVTNNKFSTSIWPNGGFYGAPVIDFSTSDPGNVFTNNTWYDGPLKGQLVNP